VTILNDLRAGLAAVLAGLAIATGCQQTAQQRPAGEPGHLPGRSESDRTPRLNATTYFAHGHLLERQGEFERAVVQYRQALELAPNFVSARNRLGITLNKMGQHGQASAEFRRVLETHPHLTYVQNNLGFSYYLEGKYELAEATLRDALSRKPNFPRARMNYGVVLGRLGRFREAFEQFSQAVSEADAWYNVALLQTEAGLYAEAARSLEMALRLNPGLEAARLQLRDISRLAAAQQESDPATLAAGAEVRAAEAPDASADPITLSAHSSGPPAEPRSPADIPPKPDGEAVGDKEATEEARLVDRRETHHPAAQRTGVETGWVEQSETHQNPQLVGSVERGETHLPAALQSVSELLAPPSPFLSEEELAAEENLPRGQDPVDSNCDAAEEDEQTPPPLDEELAWWLRELSRYVTELTSRLGDRWCELREHLLALADQAASGGTAE